MRGNSIHEIHNDLDAVDEDAFDKIIENEKALRKSKDSNKKAKRVNIE